MKNKKFWTYLIKPDVIDLWWLEKIFVIDYASAKSGKWHIHPEIELIFKLEGESSYDLSERPSITLTAGQALVIPPNFSHRLGDEIDSPGQRLCLMIRSHPSNPPSGALLGQRAFSEFRAALLAKSLVPFPCPKPILAHIRQLMDLVLVRKARLSATDRVRLRIAVTDAFCNVTAEPPKKMPSEVRLMDEATAYLDNHLAKNVSIRDLVAYMGYGQTRFFQLFREHTGISPNEWLIRRRIERAKSLLTTTDKTVISIARQVGFTDQGYFCRIFRRHTGHTPNGFRLYQRQSQGRRTHLAQSQRKSALRRVPHPN